MIASRNKTVVFWGAGATHALGMVTTQEQNEILFALSRKSHSMSYHDCLSEFKENVFGDRIDDVCDLLTILDDGGDPKEGADLSGFTEKQLDVIQNHSSDLGATKDKQKNRVIMMRIKYDWASVMRIIRLHKNDVEITDDGEEEPSYDYAQKIYNQIDHNIAVNSGFHVFGNETESVSSFIDTVRLKAAKSALVMFISLVFACAWERNRLNSPIRAYSRFADLLSDIRVEEYMNSECPNPLFSTVFVSMNFDPILWWLIKNADARYNKSPRYVGRDNSPLYLGEDVDQVDDVRPFSDVEESVSAGVLHDYSARFINERTRFATESVAARYQTVKIYFPHGSPNLKICPCCRRTTLYQGNELSDSSESLFPPFFFKRLTWDCVPVQLTDMLSGDNEERKWSEGELDYIQCRHCGRAIRMCDTEMLMQSGLKTSPSHVLQRIQHNVDNDVMQANHIVLMGYSLPLDDGAWIAELQSRTTRKKAGEVRCSIVDFVDGESNKWISGKDLFKYDTVLPVIARARAVFGEENIRVNLSGIPSVFTDLVWIKDLLYPEQW